MQKLDSHHIKAILKYKDRPYAYMCNADAKEISNVPLIAKRWEEQKHNYSNEIQQFKDALFGFYKAFLNLLIIVGILCTNFFVLYLINN